MYVAILYHKQDCKLIDYFDDITSVQSNRIDYSNGYIEDWNNEEVELIVVVGFSIERKVEGELIFKSLIDSEGNKYAVGDILPTGLNDLSKQFTKKTFDDLVAENETLKQELANTNAMMLEFMETILN